MVIDILTVGVSVQDDLERILQVELEVILSNIVNRDGEDDIVAFGGVARPLRPFQVWRKFRCHGATC